MSINEVIGQLRHPAWLKLKGPWLTGQRVVEPFEQTMLTYQCKVARGTSFPAADLPFGYFVTVQPFNTAESILEIVEVPPQEGGEHVFAERITPIKRFNEFICAAHISKQIVELGTAADNGNTVWESKVDPIDDKHALKTTVYVDALTSITRHEWDEGLQQYVQVVETLQNTGGASSVGVVSTTVTHTFYTQLKCDWYKKTVETFTVVDREYKTTVDFYWPAVLVGFDHIAVNRKDLPDGSAGGANYYSFPEFSKEAYRGPTEALVEEIWSLEPLSPFTPLPQVMQPLPVTITSPFVSINLGPCLHAAFTYTITITDDPEFESAALDYGFAATTPTDWPASLIAAHEQNPSRGGYLRRKITVYAPTY